jgi:hypothetical protein
VVNEYGRLTTTRKISAGQWYQYFKQRIKVPKLEHARDRLKGHTGDSGKNKSIQDVCYAGRSFEAGKQAIFIYQSVGGTCAGIFHQLHGAILQYTQPGKPGLPICR